jgi:hypothetical protein
MTPCKRGCCWTTFQVCAKARECDCHTETLAHWLGVKTTNEPPVRLGHRDPTANEAVANAMRAHRKGQR